LFDKTRGGSVGVVLRPVIDALRPLIVAIGLGPFVAAMFVSGALFGWFMRTASGAARPAYRKVAYVFGGLWGASVLAVILIAMGAPGGTPDGPPLIAAVVAIALSSASIPVISGAFSQKSPMVRGD
jgi:hypothetical protein